MAKWLIHCSGDTCVRVGRAIVARLDVDPRLVQAAGTLHAALDPLEQRNTAWHAVVSERTASASRDDGAYRELEGVVRELGLVTLSTTGGHHDDDPYLRIFPDGYGDAVRLSPARIVEFSDIVLGKLADVADPRFVSLRERIGRAKETFVTVHESHEALLRSRKEAYELLEVAKRDFAAAIPLARAQALAACQDRRYVRAIFAPAMQKRRKAAAAETPGEGTVTAPAPAGTPAAAPSGVVPNPPARAPAAPPREAAA